MDKHRQQFHEMRNPSQNSSLWKNTLKQRCMARMKDARGDSLKRAREDGSLASRVRDLMADEIRQLKSARDLNGFFPDTPDTSGDDYVNIMRMLEEELMSELKEQEAVLIQQYEDMKRLEEEELQETVARYFDPDTDGENGALVPCPICMQNKLIQNKQVIFCACGGFRLDLKDAGVTLVTLQQQLFDRFATHNKKCTATPQFEVQNQFGISALYLKCSVCDSLDVVI